MIKEYALLSWTNISKRKLRSWLTLIGVVIGIAAVISLIGLGEGLRSFVLQQFSVADPNIISVQASGLNAGPPGSGVVDPLTERQLQAIRNVRGVQTAIGRIIQIAVFEYNGKTAPTFFISVPEGRFRRDTYEIANYEADEGRLLRDRDTTSIVVGYEFRDESTFGKPINIGSKLRIMGTDYTVVGFLKRTGSFVVDAAVLMNEIQMREQFEIPKDKYDLMAVKVSKGSNIEEVQQSIERVLRRERNVREGEEDFTVQTREAAIKNLNDTLFAVQLFIYIIAGISILVGGIGIMNTMYTAVLERTKDIGTMKAIGARNSTIFQLFFIESGMIGLVGGLVGIILGAGLAYSLAFGAGQLLGQDMIRAEISLWLVLGALVFSFAVGTIAGVLPARNASKLSPVDALAYEK